MTTGLAAEPSPPRAPARPRRRRAPDWAPPAALFVVACAVYVVLALRVPLPVLFPDELRYSHLARSLADGDGFTWRGDHVGQSAALYIYVIAPLWAVFSSTVDAWHASKVLSTILMCTQVVPVWLLGRALAGPRVALAAAALAVTGTSMLLTAGILTEDLAMPLATAALCAAVAALRTPGSRWWFVALGLTLLAAWARLQLGVLIPAFVVALGLDAWRVGAGARGARLRAHRAALAVCGGLTAAGALVALLHPSTAGDYAGYFDFRPGLATIFSKSALQLAELAAVSGVAPLLLAAGAASSPAVWRDARTGPLLAVLWPAAIALCVQSGFFLAGYAPAPSGIQRYVAFASPLALLLALVLIGDARLLSRHVLVVAGLCAPALLLRQDITMIGEERAAWATGFRLHQLLGVGPNVALALVGAALVGATALLARRPRGTPALAVAALLGLVLVVQSQAAWHQMTRTASVFRAQLPGDLEWIDHTAGGPTALLALTQNAPQYEDLELFNRDIAAVYVPPTGLPGRPVQGRTCSYSFAASGRLVLSPGCGPVPRRFLFDDPAAAITFHDEARSVSDPRLGRLVTLRAGATPRAQSVLVLACPRASPVFSSTSPDIVGVDAPRACNATATGTLWLDAPAQVVLTYRGGARPHTVTVGAQRTVVPAGGTAQVRLRAPAGASTFTLHHDWISTLGAPELVRGTLEARGRTVRIL